MSEITEEETMEERPKDYSYGLSHQRLHDIKEAFELYDTDNSGYIDAKELHVAMSALGSEMTEEQINQLIADADEDGNGVLDFDEFCYIMTAQSIERETKEQITRAFSLIDKDGDGKISAVDIESVKADLSDFFCEREIRDMIEDADRRRDGQIHIDEFMKMMRSFICILEV
ncbi:hypothetical protein V2J09_007803 [Rumex salicifolius]